MRAAGMSPLANPVAIAIALVALVLVVSGMSYQRYFAGAQFVHFLLGPATVALAVPLARQVPRLRRNLLPLACALLCGCVTPSSARSAWRCWARPRRNWRDSIAPKSATTPIAMAVSERLGGVPALTAVLVIGTGIVGAVCGALPVQPLRIESHAARGLALGVASHGIGTARAFQVSAEMGAYAGPGHGPERRLTALLAPWLVPLLLRWIG
jgi:putative effector of murein hydrolase